jgi:integrase/recombinase XerD
MENYLEKFSENLKITGSSEKTIKIYSFFVKKYLSWLEENNKSIQQSGSEDLKKYAESLSSYSSKSQSFAMSALKFFYNNVLQRQEQMPVMEIKKQSQEVLSKEDIKKLADSADTNKSRLIISFIYSTGLKVSELVNLKVSDIDLENKSCKVNGANKSRQITLNEEICKEIKSYFEKNNPPAFVFSKKEKPLTSRNIQKIIKNTAVKAGLERKITPHTLRQSFAKHLIDSGIEESKVNSLLGYKLREKS